MLVLLQRSFLRSPLAYLQFALVLGVLFGVNLLESAFARSLVECHVPVVEGEFTGSAFCGDRAFVISQGQRFFGIANSVEHALSAVGLLSTALIADRYGRRIVLVTGATCIWISSIIFWVSTIYRSHAAALYIVAQALQGFLNFDLLAGIVAGDLTALPEADSESVFMVMFITTACLRLLGGLVYLIFSVAECLNFQALWMWVSVATFVCVFVTLWSPETMPKKGDASIAEQPLSVVDGIRKELTEYREMLRSEPLARKLAARDFLFTVSDTTSIEQSFLMGTHGFSQRLITLVSIPHYPWSILSSMSTVFFIRWLGERQTYTTFKIGILVVVLVCAPLMPLSAVAVFGMSYSLALLKHVDEGLERPLNHECIQEAYQAKSKALWSVLFKLAMPIPLCVYAQLYNAKAETFFFQGLPFFISALFRTLGFIVQWVWVWQMHAPQLDIMEKERILKMERAYETSSDNPSMTASCSRCLGGDGGNVTVPLCGSS